MTVVEGVIPNVLSTKHLGSTFQLVFTERRLIISRSGVSWAVASGFGAVGAAVAMASSKKSLDAIDRLDPQRILHSRKKNWEAPYVTINKVRLKKAWTCCHLHIFYTDGKKDYFEFSKPLYDDAKTLLGSLFPHSLETKP